MKMSDSCRGVRKGLAVILLLLIQVFFTFVGSFQKYDNIPTGVDLRNAQCVHCKDTTKRTQKNENG